MEISFPIPTLTCFTVRDSGSTQLNHHKQSVMETNCTIKLVLKLCLLHLQQLGMFFFCFFFSCMLCLLHLPYLWQSWATWRPALCGVILFLHMVRLFGCVVFLLGNQHSPPVSSKGLERRELLNGLKINRRGGMEQKPLRKPKRGRFPR